MRTDKRVVEPNTDSRSSPLVEVAVRLAMQGRWIEAVDLNRWIIERAVDDASAHNRLGRALEALGRSAEAHKAYSAALAIDPHNPIAARRLGHVTAGSPAAPPAAVPGTESDSRPWPPIDYGRLEPRVEEPPELQEGYLQPYEEYEEEQPEQAVAERAELAAELLEEARFEELEGAVSAEILEQERQQQERDHEFAAEEESDER